MRFSEPFSNSRRSRKAKQLPHHRSPRYRPTWVFFLLHIFLNPRFYFPASSRQAAVSGVVPSHRHVPSVYIAHRVQHSRCSSIFIEMLLLIAHALALSSSQFVHKKRSPRSFSSMHSRRDSNSPNSRITAGRGQPVTPSGRQVCITIYSYIICPFNQGTLNVYHGTFNRNP